MRVTTGHESSSSPVVHGPRRLPGAVAYRNIGYALVAILACGAVLAMSAIVTTRGDAATAVSPEAVVEPTPSAIEFAVIFVHTTNAHPSAQGDHARIANPDCVQASPGRYMCSYVSRRPSGVRECRVMQAEWKPGQASSYAVTLAGRAARCGSLRQALRSLR